MKKKTSAKKRNPIAKQVKIMRIRIKPSKKGQNKPIPERSDINGATEIED